VLLHSMRSHRLCDDWVVVQLHRVVKKVRAFVVAKLARKLKTVKAAADAAAPAKPLKGKAAALVATPEAIAKLDNDLNLAKVCMKCVCVKSRGV
jgi:hypothetical protein